MNLYRHPRLLALDNGEYLAEMSVRADLTRIGRLREPSETSASSRIAAAFEEIVRTALTRASKNSENRVLAYEEFHTRFGYTRRYRELDAIYVSTAITVLEIKATRSEKSALKGRRQLRKIDEILASGTLGRTHKVVQVLLWIDTGANSPEFAAWQTAETPEELSVMVFDDAQDTEPLRRVRVPAIDAWAWRQKFDVLVEEGLWEALEKEQLAVERRRVSLAQSGE